MTTPTRQVKVAYPPLDVQEKARGSYLKEMKQQYNALMAPGGVARDLVLQAFEEYPSQERKARDWWRTNAVSDPAIIKFLKDCNPPPEKQKFFLNKLLQAAFGLKPVAKIWNSLKRYLAGAYVERQRGEAKSTLYERGLPPKLVERFLPKPFSFEVAPDGTIIKEFSIFGNRKKTIERKSRDMSRILAQWNELVDTLNTDLVSSDPVTRLTSLVVSLMLHTGIRPSAGGTSRLKDEKGKTIKDDKGNPLFIKTVGATGLKLEHINFIRNDFATLEFPGKSGTKNIAELTDASLVQALKTQVEAAKLGKSNGGLVFVTPNGRRISVQGVNKYLHNLLGPTISATDFRKLKATEVFYQTLRQQRAVVVAQLKKLEAASAATMSDKIVTIIYNQLEVAALAASKAISHKTEVSVAVESYIDPHIILEYLSTGGLDRALSEVVGSGIGLHVEFDPFSYYKTVTGREAPVTAATLFSPGKPFLPFAPDDLIEELEPPEPTASKNSL